MTESINPYHKWLNLPSKASKPSYYQMLGLPEFESNGSRIAEAADRAIARVRSFKPGPHAREWSRLIDELKAAKECLLEPAIKAEYDRCLTESKERPKSGDDHPAGSGATPAKAPVNADRLPPGMAPRFEPTAGSPSAIAPAMPIAAAQAPMSLSNASQFPTGVSPASVDGLLPAASYPTSDPSPAAMVPPGWGSPTPGNEQLGYGLPGHTPTGYGTPLAVDPMAPVGSLPVPAQPMPHQALPAQAMYQAASYAAPASAYPAAMPSPVPAAPDGPALSLGGGQSALAAANARRAARARRNLAAAAVAGCLLIAVAAVVYANRHAILAQLDPQLVANNTVEPEQVDTSGDVSQLNQATDVKDKARQAKDEPSVPLVAPLPVPQPQPMPELAPNPVPAPETVPMPAPETKSEVTPESAPVSAPMPEPPPMPVVMPTKAELVALGKALTQGRSALARQEFASADKAIAEAESLANLPDHQAMTARLKEVASYVKQFRNAVDQALKALQPGAEIKVGNSTMVVVVQVSADRLTIRRAGGNVTYPAGEIPAGLAMALADSWLNENDPVNRVIRGSYFAVAEGAEEVHREKAKKYWDEAQSAGVDVKHLLPFLTDKYDLENQVTAAKPDASE